MSNNYALQLTVYVGADSLDEATRIVQNSLGIATANGSPIYDWSFDDVTPLRLFDREYIKCERGPACPAPDTMHNESTYHVLTNGALAATVTNLEA